ncbi:MAG: MFS transporter [Streptosporangiaceae bacterium]
MRDPISRRASYRSALRSPDLRVLLGSGLISASGSWAYNVALMVLLYERTHSAAWVAAGAAGRFLPALAFSAYGGVIAERFERVRLMVWLNLAALALQAGLAVAAWQRAPALVYVLLAAATSVLMTGYEPAVAALVPQVVGEDDLAAANALNAMIQNLVVVVGPAVGAALLLGGGPTLAIAVNALTFGVAAAWLPRLSARSAPSDVTGGGRAGPIRQITAGFRTLASSSAAMTFVGFSVLASFLYGTDTVLFIPISRFQLHTGTSGYGYLLAGLGVGGIAGAAVVNRLAARRRLAAAILGGIAAYCLPTALLIVVHQPVAGFALQVVRGAGTLVVDTLAITALQRSVRRDMVARVYGAFLTLVLAAISLGALITPVLLRAGLHLTMLIYGVGVPALCLLTLPWLLAADRRAAAAATAMAPRVALLERLGLFLNASRSSLESLAESAEEVSVPAGAVIMAEGEEADAFFILTDGELEVAAVGERHSGPVRLGTLAPVSYAGEIGLLGQMPRTATVTARSPAQLLRIDGAAFLSALTSLTASPMLLTQAQSRLATTHPARALAAPLDQDDVIDDVVPVPVPVPRVLPAGSRTVSPSDAARTDTARPAKPVTSSSMASSVRPGAWWKSMTWRAPAASARLTA